MDLPISLPEIGNVINTTMWNMSVEFYFGICDPTKWDKFFDSIFDCE